MADILDAAQTTSPTNPQSVIDAAVAPPPAEPAPAPITTEEPAPAPAPVMPVQEESLIVPPPPPEKPVEPEHKTPPPTMGTMGGKKPNVKALVAGILLLLLMLPLVTVVVRQQQEIRSRATENCGSYPCQTVDTTGVCPAAGQDASYACADASTCVKRNSRICNQGTANQFCCNAVVDPSNCPANSLCHQTGTGPGTNTNSCVSHSIVNGNQMTNCTSCTGTNAGTCTPGQNEFLVVCTCNADQLDSNGYCGANCHQVTGSVSCNDLAAQTCQTVQLDLKSTGAGQDTWNGTINETVICQPPASCTPPATTVTPPPGCQGSDCNPTPPPPSCQDIKIQKGTTVLSADDLKTLKSGDVVTLIFAAAHTTKARFQVNGADLSGVAGQWTETTTKNASGEYTIDWTVPAGTTSFDISAQSFDGESWN